MDVGSCVGSHFHVRMLFNRSGRRAVFNQSFVIAESVLEYNIDFDLKYFLFKDILKYYFLNFIFNTIYQNNQFKLKKFKNSEKYNLTTI